MKTKAISTVLFLTLSVFLTLPSVFIHRASAQDPNANLPSKPAPKTTPKKTTRRTTRSAPRPKTKVNTQNPSTVTTPPNNNVSASRPQNLNIELVKIPPGSFMMGSTDGLDDEEPVHQVTINYFFYMGKYEVTQAQWQALTGKNPSKFKDCGNCPVEYVSWNDAQDFIRKLNQMNDGYTYRLPTEAEWEYACRAGTTEDYAGALNEMAWDLENSESKTHAVGSKQPNAWGLSDMHGNVWEWCEDWYHDDYNGAPADGSAWLSGGEQESRVLRGGSFFTPAVHMRSAKRAKDTPGVRFGNYGFVGLRVVAVARI